MNPTDTQFVLKFFIMKIVVFVLLACMPMALTPSNKIRIIFFGDSITQMGADKGGYIDLLQQHIREKGLQDKYELIGAGIGGNKVYDLYLRHETDVLAKHPNKVFIYIGINDVWHKTSLGTGTDMDKFEKFYVALIAKFQARKIDVTLCTPTVIGEKKDNANPQDADLNSYSDIVRKLAVTYKCKLVDLRKVFTDYERDHNPENKESGILTTDRVHLNETGNKLVASEIQQALAIP